MARRFDVDAAIKRDLDAWLLLFGLGKKWRVTYELRDGVVGGHESNMAWADYNAAKDGRRTLHIQFSRRHMTSPSVVEETVIHELLHLFDHGLGLPPALHRFIGRLERPLRLARVRARREVS